MNSTSDAPDPRLTAAHDVALAALREITPAETIGDPVGHTVEGEGVVSLRFANRMLGYPGWIWTVTLTVVDDAEPTVLETELLPGDGALLAPDWVPWAVRLAEYHEAQSEDDERRRAEADDGASHAEASDDGASDGDETEAEDPDEATDEEDLDEDDYSADGSSILHSGDVDGVDIDVLDDPSEDDSSADEDE